MSSVTGQITKQAFGKQARLGSLYDIRRDQFEGGSLFKETPPGSMITLTDSHFTDYIVDENLSQKETFKKLNVEASLKLSLMAGLIQADGSAKYLTQTKTDSRTVRVTFIFNIKTKRETLAISSDRLSEYFSFNAFENADATHFVIGITWGARIAATFEQVVSNSEAAEDLQGKLAVHLEKLGSVAKLDGDAKLEHTEKENSKFESLKINFSGDVSIEIVPRTLEDVYAIFQSIPLKLKEINQGKGQQLEFEFYPLKQIAQMFKYQLKIDRKIQEVKENVIIRIEDIFEDILQGERKLNDFVFRIRTWEKYLPAEWLKTTLRKQQELAAIRLETQQSIASVLLQIRRGESDEKQMVDLLNQFPGNLCSLQAIEEYLESNAFIEKKIKCLSEFDQNVLEKTPVKTSATFPNPAILFTEFDSIDDLNQRNYNHHIYLLHICNQWIEKDRSNWYQQLRFWTFLYKSEPTESICRVIDHDLHRNLDHRPETCVIYYAHHGTIVSKDYYQTILSKLTPILLERYFPSVLIYSGELPLRQIRNIQRENQFLTLENNDIEKLHGEFISNYPSGQINEQQLVHEFQKFYPECDSRHFCNLLFPVVDRDQNGQLNFLEYMSVVSLTVPCQTEQKFSLIFAICSQNKERVDRNGLMEYLRVVCLFKSKKFNEIDLSTFQTKDNLTKEEFLSCFKSNGQLTMVFLPPLSRRYWTPLEKPKTKCRHRSACRDRNDASHCQNYSHLECIWGSECKDKNQEHLYTFCHSETIKSDHNRVQPCRYGVNCRLQRKSPHNLEYSHPCRFAEQCRNRENEKCLTHAPLNAPLCKYDRDCRDLTKPMHRCQYRHTELPYYLVPCREQVNCTNESKAHRIKYSHGEQVGPVQAD